MIKGEKRQFCPQGHDTFIVGRVTAPNGLPQGRCKTCQNSAAAKNYNKNWQKWAPTRKAWRIRNKTRLAV